MSRIDRWVLRVVAAAVAAMVVMAAAPSAQARLFRANAELAKTKSATLGGECYQPCIHYKYHRGCKVCCDCKPPIKMVLLVKDPCCCGCAVEVPVCLPSCCAGEPCVSHRCGLFGRGIVEYSWKCGYRIKMVFTKRGDLFVHYYGS